MQFQGRIFKLFPVQSGTSSRGEWMKQDFIFEYFEQPTDRYADRVLLSVMNDRIRDYDLHEGDEVIIGFGHNTREYQGRYFNDVRMYHFEKVKQVEKATAQPSPTENGQAQEPQQPVQQNLFSQQPQATQGDTPQVPTDAAKDDDLPF